MTLDLSMGYSFEHPSGRDTILMASRWKAAENDSTRQQCYVDGRIKGAQAATQDMTYFLKSIAAKMHKGDDAVRVLTGLQTLEPGSITPAHGTELNAIMQSAYFIVDNAVLEEARRTIRQENKGQGQRTALKDVTPTGLIKAGAKLWKKTSDANVLQADLAQSGVELSALDKTTMEVMRILGNLAIMHNQKDDGKQLAAPVCEGHVITASKALLDYARSTLKDDKRR